MPRNRAARRGGGGAAAAAAAAAKAAAGVEAVSGSAPKLSELRAHWTAQRPLINGEDAAARAMADPLIIRESACVLRCQPPLPGWCTTPAAQYGETGGRRGEIPAQVQVLCKSPLVYVVDDFLCAGECEYLIQLAEPQMARAVVTGTGGPKVTADRTSRVAWLPDPRAQRGDASAGGAGETAGQAGEGEQEADEVLVELERRLCTLLGCRAECTEPFQVIHYSRGQEYVEHVDGYDASTRHGLRNCARGGNRLVTALLYLNDVQGGGHTTFSELGLSVEPRQGRVLVFHNCEAATPSCVDRRTLHSGTAVEAGEKWAVNKWVRQFPLRSAGCYDYVL